VLAQLQQQNPEIVRLVFRNFPLISIHDKAAMAAQASLAANEQGKFWEMHDLLFATQPAWSSLKLEDFSKWLTIQAAKLGLDQNKFEADLTREDIVKAATDAWENGKSIGLPGTPVVLINGQLYNGPLDLNSLNQVASLLAISRKQYQNCPPLVIDPSKSYLAYLKTEKGDIVIELFADKAPNTVNNFVFLAREGWYNNNPFYRVIENQVAQTGDPTGTGMGNPGYFIDTEISPGLLFDKPGIVGMANSGPNMNGSQFFITSVPAPNLDGAYTIFGQVISGMDVLAQLTPRNPQVGEVNPPGDRLISITIEEK
jgi:cyclophilin family peptidyl-prolyl cis-trans isomerase